MSKATLGYVYDPMCSWCWGYRPTWLKLEHAIENKLHSSVSIKYFVGGLAPDSMIPMAEDMQEFLKTTWEKIAATLGSSFNFDFWDNCQPRRSTYPACRAVLAARAFGLEKEMLYAIQQSYYLNAKNPSNDDVLISAAIATGIDGKAFENKFYSDEVAILLNQEVEIVNNLPVRGFPSLVMYIGGKSVPIKLDYKNWRTSFEEVERQLVNLA